MRILQIRGRNLASLAGDFALDFERGPLAEAGLFAISGPTGAGKSTLLDALSLALYDRTPRLEASSAYQIPDGPDEALGVHDPRTLLRRGTAEGLAEVRFIGNDGRRYRASWAVRRARNRVGGKLQQSEVELVDEDSRQPLGRTKKEVLAATERAVGLTFDQFRRSMLLAQGDFAAFLKAKSDERSELLERMTGTELYSDVSRRAYQMARELEESLRLQEEAAAALPVLDLEARAALLARVAELGQAVAGTARRLGALREQKTWWTKAAELSQKLEQARARLAAATSRWAEAAPRRAALADLERLSPLRAVDQEASRTADELTAAKQQRTAALSAAAQARAEAERAAAALALASKGHQLRRAEAEAARPQLDAARALDQALVEKTKAVQAVDKKLEGAADGLAALEREGRALAERRAAVSATLQKLAGWVEANGPVVALAKGWDEGVAPQVRAFEKTHAGWKARLGSLPALQAAHDKALAAQAVAQRELAAAEAAAQAAQEQVRAAEAAEAALPSANLAERRAALEAQRVELAELQQQRERAAKAEHECQSCRAGAATASREAADAEAQAGLAAAARAEVEQQLAGTARLLVQLGLEAHRARLVEGEPCPLCGSTHHPGTGPVEATVAGLEAQRGQQTERQAELARREAAERARAEERHRRARELQSELEGRQAELAAAAARWKTLGCAGAVLEAGSSDGLAARALALSAEAQAIAERDDALARLRAAAGAARTSHAESVGRVERARSALKVTEGDVAAALERRSGAATDAAALRRELDGALANLAHAFGGVDGWQVELEADPRAFTASWAARVDDARHAAQARESAGKQLADVETQREVQASALAHAAQQRAALGAERAQAASDRDAAATTRREVLQGRPAAEVEAALQVALAASERARAAAAEQAERTREDAARKEEAHKLAVQAAERAAEAGELAARALAEALSAAGVDAATLRAKLEHDEQWVGRERAALNELERLRDTEAKAADERQLDLSAHEAPGAPTVPLADVEASLATLEPQHGEQSQQLGAAKQRLEQDDEHRATFEARARQLAQARRDAMVWQQLDTLIGSADGKKFRKFAQSMTMELLLAHANAELASLAPRYVLQRVKAQDLELQVVDRDMGDEVRSTASLSGGETFLASLALALGLSSLASEKVRIESLFVDEGFGSLDPSALETALSTLDSLQSAGRKVGLISHVPGLAERIGAQVLVERQGRGASTVRVVAGAA